MESIPYARHTIDDSDIAAVVETLRQEFIAQGPQIEEFENAVAGYCGARFAVAVSSGTAALHIAAMACGLKRGDIGWTTPLTFVASANCILYSGADIDFVDIDPATLNIGIDNLKRKLKESERPPRVVIPVHFGGLPAGMEEVFAIGKEFGFSIIEDGCHAIGSIYKGKKIGCCKYSDMTVFSFHPAKNITTGEGGMVLTNREDLYIKLLRYRTHGITRDIRFMENEPDGQWYYEQLDLGFNYRITDIQAALGISQLKKLDGFNSKRNELARRYDERLAGLPLITPPKAPVDGFHSYHLYPIRLRLDSIKRDKRYIFDELRAAGIGVNLHYIPVHLHPYYARLGFRRGDFPMAERYYEEAITLPMFPTLTYAQQDRIIAELTRLLKQA